MNNNQESGKIIFQAHKIIQKTYQEINTMKSEIEEVLNDKDPNFEFVEEYSYYSKYLILKEKHTIVFKKKITNNPKEELYLSFIIIFMSSDDIKKISSIEEPEIWISKIKIKDAKEVTRPWDITECLTIDYRKYFTIKDLEIGGKLFDFRWKDEKGNEEWSGQFIGYPLTAIADKTFIKNEIIDKLIK